MFWTTSIGLGWVYVGYPIVVAAAARLRPVRLAAEGMPPTVAVAIAVHDEAGQIEERLRDVLAQAGAGVELVEVLVGSDGSTDETDAVVRRLAVGDPRIRLVAAERAGQTATQARLFDVASADVVVLTDAETRFAPGCLAALVAPFRDPRVGCVTGRLEWREERATATSSNEGLYWRYERAVRNVESRAGWLTAVTGALLAVRRTSYRHVPPIASMDHLLPLYVREAGGLVLYEPAAVATDRPISGLREQFRNRTRTATRGIRANISMVGRLAPWRQPSAALAIWSHKLLRWATPWLALAVAVSGAVLAWSGSPVYALAPAGLLAAAIAAATAHVIAGTGRRPPRLLAFARAFGVVNLAFAIAWLNVIRGKQIEAWRRTEFEMVRARRS